MWRVFGGVLPPGPVFHSSPQEDSLCLRTRVTPQCRKGVRIFSVFLWTYILSQAQDFVSGDLYISAGVRPRGFQQARDPVGRTAH